MLMRLGFAVAAHLEPEILIVDEILAVGDEDFQRRCIQKIDQVSKRGRTILFVSHSMPAVEALCSRCVLLRSGLAVAEGPVHAVIAAYRAEAELSFEPVVSLANHSGRPGGLTALMRSIRLRDSRGRISSSFRPGETVQILVEHARLPAELSPVPGNRPQVAGSRADLWHRQQNCRRFSTLESPCTRAHHLHVTGASARSWRVFAGRPPGRRRVRPHGRGYGCDSVRSPVDRCLWNRSTAAPCIRSDPVARQLGLGPAGAGRGLSRPFVLHGVPFRPVKHSICFLTFRETLGPIFSSVYVNPAAELQARGHNVSVLCVSSLGEFVKPWLRRRWRDLRREVQERASLRIRRVPTASKAWDDAHVDSRVTSIAMRGFSNAGSPGIIHAGGARAAVLACSLRRHHPALRVVYQVWGPDAAEYESGASADGESLADIRRRADRLDQLQREAMHLADLVVCISTTMKTWAIERFGITNQKLVVIPCFCDTDHALAEAPGRDELRASLGYASNDFVVAYSGSMLSWQLSARSLRILSALSACGRSVHFMGLSMHAAALRSRVAECGFPERRTRILSVDHREVARYIAAADLGILGRNLFEPLTLVNALSSPIKFGEYLAAGTPVVLSQGIGDFSDLAQEERVGVVMPCDADGRTTQCLLERHLREYPGGPGHRPTAMPAGGSHAIRPSALGWHARRRVRRDSLLTAEAA